MSEFILCSSICDPISFIPGGADRRDLEHSSCIGLRIAIGPGSLNWGLTPFGLYSVEAGNVDFAVRQAWAGVRALSLNWLRALQPITQSNLQVPCR